METVVNRILTALEKSGFPEKKVTLPFQAIFKSCKKHETTLSNVLKHLETSDVLHEMVSDRILFYHRTLSPAKKTAEKRQATGSDPGISEEVYTDAMEKLKNMDPQEVERIKEQVMNMSPEEQAGLLKRAQEMFQKEK